MSTPAPAARPDWPSIYNAQHAALTREQIAQIRAKAEQWQLASVLASGGVVVFPHAAVLDCGHQVAAAVNAVLDSGKDKVLVVSVLHAWTDEMRDARSRLATGEDLSSHPLRGIHGPEMPKSRPEWQLDHALISWRFFWQAECERRGIEPKSRPRVREVYPFLAGDKPQTLTNYDEVAAWAHDAALVSTADPFHHGVGYGDTNLTAHAPEKGGLDLARATIERGNGLLAAARYHDYLQHCVVARNDARDAGPLFRALAGSLQPQLLDLVASDMAQIYGAPQPTWVAAALVAWHPA